MTGSEVAWIAVGVILALCLVTHRLFWRLLLPAGKFGALGAAIIFLIQDNLFVALVFFLLSMLCYYLSAVFFEDTDFF
jgi:hypothetical protein